MEFQKNGKEKKTQEENKKAPGRMRWIHMRRESQKATLIK